MSYSNGFMAEAVRSLVHPVWADTGSLHLDHARRSEETRRGSTFRLFPATRIYLNRYSTEAS